MDLDDNLIMKAMSLASVKTKKEVVNLALSDLVNKMKKQELAKLWGEVIFGKVT